MQVSFQNGYALLIGVGSHSHPSWSLPVTVRDVEALRDVLTHPTHCAYPADVQHIRLLRNEQTTKANVLSAMDDLAASTATDLESTAVVYYSGHGWLRDDGQYFLVPHDADPQNLGSTALPAEDFTLKLRNIQAQRLLVILDTCHAEGMAEAKDLPRGFNLQAFPEGLVEVLGGGCGRAVLSSCGGGESSWVLPDGTLSLFTQHLLEALKGAGNSPGETRVTVADLMKYVSREVQASAMSLLGKRQTPYFKIDAEDFAVAVIPGGKKWMKGTQEERGTGETEAESDMDEIEARHIGVAGRCHSDLSDVGTSETGVVRARFKARKVKVDNFFLTGMQYGTRSSSEKP